MLDVIVYDSAEKKNQLEAEYAKTMSPIEGLKLYLDLMDLYKNFKSKEIQDREDDGIEWIILERKKH